MGKMKLFFFICHLYHEIYLKSSKTKQLPVGLMVLSDGMLHFLKIEIFFKQIYQNYLVALNGGNVSVIFITKYISRAQKQHQSCQSILPYSYFKTLRYVCKISHRRE